jgi:hypothetical protein
MIWVVLSALSVAGCATGSALPPFTSDDDVAVLSAALHTVRTFTRPPDLVVVHDTTSFADEEFVPAIRPQLDAFLTEVAPEIPRELISALPAANTQPILLTRLLPLRGQEVFASSVSIDSIRRSQTDDGTYGDRPYALVFVTLSRPAYSADGKHAVLMIDLFCGGRCGTQELVALKRQGASWELLSRVPLRMR